MFIWNSELTEHLPFLFAESGYPAWETLCFQVLVIKNMYDHMQMCFWGSEGQKKQRWGVLESGIQISSSSWARGWGGTEQLYSLWLFMVFPFSLFLVPLAGSSHCCPAPGRYRGQWRYEREHFAPYWYFLNWLVVEILGNIFIWRVVFLPRILEFSPPRCSIKYIFCFVP